MATYTLNPSQSTLKWTGRKKIGKTEEGTVLIAEGEITVEDGKITGGKFTIDMNSISSTNLKGAMKEKLEGHLKSDDFFSVEEFPKANFEITKVEDGSVTGNLTVKEITNAVSFPADIEISEDEITAKAQFEIDRSKWNVRYGSGSFFDNLGDDLILDEVGIELELIASKS